MSEAGDRKVSVSRVINAPAQQIFDILADPAMHPVIDGYSVAVCPSNHL